MLFKILHGDPSNISLEVTPFHDGWAYVTHDGFFYIDLNVGTEESPNNQRIKINAGEAEKLLGYDIATVLNDSDIEIPTSQAVIEAIETASISGENGATFIPSVSNDGIISWTNDKGLTNPSPVNIKGRGIDEIYLQVEVDNVKDYAIKYTDGTYSNFQVTDGKSAYQYAKDGGYTGTESEFIQLLNNIDDTVTVDEMNNALAQKTQVQMIIWEADD